jgi:hypothetical protein
VSLIEIPRGDGRVETFTVTDAAGAVVNITGMTIRLMVKRTHSGSVLITKSVGSGVTITDGAGGVLTVTFAATETDDLAGKYVWDLEVTDGASVPRTVASGSLYVRPDVTV